MLNLTISTILGYTFLIVAYTSIITFTLSKPKHEFDVIVKTAKDKLILLSIIVFAPFFFFMLIHAQTFLFRMNMKRKFNRFISKFKLVY